jgi:hypothetical protein
VVDRPALAATLAAVLLAAGCGGGKGSAPAGTSTSPNSKQYASAQDYLRLVAPVNRSFARFEKNAALYTNATPSKRIANDSASVLAALDLFDNAVLRLNWAPVAKADVRMMVRADAALRADIAEVAYTHDFTAYIRDETSSSAAANVVRADLGLPPPK